MSSNLKIELSISQEGAEALLAYLDRGYHRNRRDKRSVEITVEELRSAIVAASAVANRHGRAHNSSSKQTKEQA